jgi:hypothetical protein
MLYHGSSKEDLKEMMERDKTKIMFIKQNDVDDVVFENCVVIENVSSFKYFGAYLVRNLNFIGHIHGLKRKIAPKLRYVVPRPLKNAVFHSFFDSYMQYAIRYGGFLLITRCLNYRDYKIKRLRTCLCMIIWKALFLFIGIRNCCQFVSSIIGSHNY